ncbi:MAG TPA: cupin domain-containing protein [Dehalococcoidia bacterium]|nr:cupin domain-containing protein [Dehalococcoidia bacterium]
MELPPGQQAGAHLHPGGVVGCVLAGEIAFAIDGQPEQTLRPGDAFYEPPGATIARFDNRSTSEAATFIAFYPLAGEQPLITML